MLEAAGGFETRFLLLNLLKHNFFMISQREFTKEIASEASTGSSINSDHFLNRI